MPAISKNLAIITPRTSRIYFLPKIHKPNNPGRPIFSACSCPTEIISSYLDKIMATIVKTLPFYIKDSRHAQLKFFVTLVSSAKQSYILVFMYIISLLLSFPMTKVSGPSNVFLITALLRNLALNNYSVWSN